MSQYPDGSTATPFFSQPRWFPELLACPGCGRDRLDALDGRFHCARCGHDLPVRGGVVHAVGPELQPWFDEQQVCWRLLNELCPQGVVERPALALLDWLRRALRPRGACRVLEIGAGRGWAARALAEEGHQVTASDVLDDPEIGVGHLVRHPGPERAACVRAQAEQLPFRAEAFDCVFGFSTLQHIPDLEAVLREVARVLKPGGWFLAFRERFRGLLSSPAQARQDTLALTVARRVAEPETAAKLGRARPPVPGMAPAEVCRRAVACAEAAAWAGLQAAVLPADVAVELAADWDRGVRLPDVVPALARAWGLDEGRLRDWKLAAERDLEQELAPFLLSHWVTVGNLDGVLLARKGDEPLAGWRPAEACRWLEPLLLACARDGFLPVYGVGPREPGGARWLNSQVGLLVPAQEAVRIVLTAPSRAALDHPLRVEVRLEDDDVPRVVVAVPPDETVAVRVALPVRDAERGSVLVRLRLLPGFAAEEEPAGEFGATRFLAARLERVETAGVPAERVAAALARRTAPRAA